MSKFSNAFKRLAHRTVGQFSWNRPQWLIAADNLGEKFQRNILIGFCAALVVLVAGLGIYQWRKNQPRPETVSVSIEPVPVTPLEKELKPPLISVRFGNSVAPLESVGKVWERGAALTPAVQGTWMWHNDSLLTFTPKNDWPAATGYTVRLDHEAFPPHVLLESYHLETQTQPFTARVKDIEFYQDAKDPSLKQVVATLEFSHSVNRRTLEERIALSMIGGSDVFTSRQNFSVHYGLHDRLVYVRSCPLRLPPREDFMKLVLAAGVGAQNGPANTAQAIAGKVRVPDLYSFLRIDSVTQTLTRNAEGDPEQILVVNTTSDVKSEDLHDKLRAWLLPRDKHTSQAIQRNYNWQSPGEVDEQTTSRSKQVPLKLIPSPHEFSKVHTFKFAIAEAGNLFVRVDKNLEGAGGFLLRNDFNGIVSVRTPPQEVEILGAGGVLALGGERKISIKSRGLHHLEFEIGRVPAEQINHLASQTEGRFEKPEFVHRYYFNEENIARIATERQTINMRNHFEANFSALDFARYLPSPTDGDSANGLFFMTVCGWDSGPIYGVKDSRFILVTDIGLLIKQNADESRDVFLQSISSGKPLANVTVEVIGKNGVALLRGVSGGDGRVSFPAFKEVRDRTPVAVVARIGDDVAFMPFERNDRVLNFSRFDIGGIQSASDDELDAFIFTERGVYRPGENVHIAVVVKKRDWAPVSAGIPLEIEVRDVRGRSVLLEKQALPESGFFELRMPTSYESPTGNYGVSVHLLRDKRRVATLGSSTFHVKEFRPDRMKIESRLSTESSAGWAAPEKIHALIRVSNLYGTPASDRRVDARMTLSPADFRFADFPGFTFFDRDRSESNSPREHQIELGSKTTDASGALKFDLGLERFAGATYRLHFFAEGFESGGGRSVNAQNTLLISSLPYLVGVKPDGDLSFVRKENQRAVEFVCLNRELKTVALDARYNVIEQYHVSVLTRQPNGNFAYESIRKERVIDSGAVRIPADGLKFSLKTDQPGNFILELRDEDGRSVSATSYTVTGHGAAARALDKNAELDVRLNRTEFSAGNEIEISITAPYTGSGLITIERDKVYSHAWFTTNETSSVQKIRVPDDFEGTGYVNVCFVRGLGSKEIFMSPLSYAVVPFVANRERHRLPVELRVSEKTKPGEPLEISFRTARPSKIAVFAVDEGILQVTDFQTPDPLDHFFRKAALMVETSQIVDLIMPEFSLLRSTSAFGGDGEPVKQLNPFRRATEKPVVFWSGIIDADETERTVIYDVPDFFNGTLRVMAVAIAPDSASAAERDVLVRGPFAITPGMPALAAPGDVFEVGVTVANNVENSGENAGITFSAHNSEHLEILEGALQVLTIPEGREISATVKIRATENLGSGSLVFRAALGAQESSLRSTVSVRPAVPYMVSVRGGNFTANELKAPVEGSRYSQYRKSEASFSALPLGLARGLDFYLQNYPHGCTEQLTSGAFCRLLLSDETDFGLSRAEVHAQLEKTFVTLRTRQNNVGGFGYWNANDSERIDFISAYATHFLVEAKAAGFPPPQDILKNALQYLRRVVIEQPNNLQEARTIAYAIYILTREGVITTNYILNLRDYLEKNFARDWRRDPAGVYLAGAFTLLGQEKQGREIIGSYRIGELNDDEITDFCQPLGADSQYLAIVARHFPQELAEISPKKLESITSAIGGGDFNTLTAAYAVLGLKSYSHHIKNQPPSLTIAEILADRQSRDIASGDSLLLRAKFNDAATALKFSVQRRGQKLPLYYQIMQAGFDRDVPGKIIHDGIEVQRDVMWGDELQLGKPIEVKIKIRSLTSDHISNVAVIDLLPGGFEIIDDSINRAGFDHVELREDRAVFFCTISPRVREISYRIKPGNRGEFIVPPVFAESMYDRKVRGRALGSKVRVID